MTQSEEEKRQKIRDNNRKYRRSPKGRAKMKEAQKRYRQTAKGKKAANKATKNSRIRTNNKYQRDYYQKHKERIKAYELAKYYKNKELKNGTN